VSVGGLKMRVRGVLGGTGALKLLARLRGHVPRWFWSRWPVCGAFEIALPGGGSLKIAGSANDWLERVQFWLGLAGDEPETYPVFMGLARQAGLVLDIGANNGIYTLLACAAGPQTRVMAFEPVPRVHAKLAANVDANGWSGRCELRLQAAADRRGTATFHAASPTRSIHSGLYPDRLTTTIAVEGNLIEVEVTTVDEACTEGLRVGLAKIDVEGYEDQVLKGMARVLEEHRPDLIIECTPEGPNREIEEILAPLGYHVFHIRESGLEPMDKITPDPRRDRRNFLFSTDPGITERLASPPASG
jgi:FkbM family methyltransferase